MIYSGNDDRGLNGGTMPKKGQHQPSETSERSNKRQAQVAAGGKTRASKPRQGRAGSESNASAKSRGR